MTISKNDKPDSMNLIDITEPGSIPYVDIPTSNFGEILAASQDVSKKGWIIMTPAGPLVIGYKQIKNILPWFFQSDDRFNSILQSVLRYLC